MGKQRTNKKSRLLAALLANQEELPLGDVQPLRKIGMVADV
jgi:hypothetical protein